MIPDAKTLQVPCGIINHNPREVARLLGYPDAAPESVADTIQDLWEQALNVIAPVCGYRWIQEGITVDSNDLTFLDVTFHCGSLITRHLQGCTGLACFAATLGPAFEDWSKGYFKEQKDPYQGYISDIIGSVMVETVADWLEEQLQAELDQQDMKRTNRLSPGYCHWSVQEQHKLFGLLPPDFCGIQLTESSLMVPIKSVSGIIGTGLQAEHHDYGCKVCTMEHCIMRRH